MREIKSLTILDENELMSATKHLEAPYEPVGQVVKQAACQFRFFGSSHK